MSRRASSFEESGDEGGVQAFDEREIGVHGCRGDGIPKRFGLFEGAEDPGNCHRRSLRGRA
ncbi:hypothetical protein GCM10009532_23260 [Microbacterium aurantiacum]